MFKFKYNFNGKVEFEYLSDGMKKLFGFEKEHFKDFNNFIDLLAKDFREPLKKEFESKLPKLKDFRFDGKYNLPKNETKWIHSHATLEKIGDNYVIYSGIAYDITDRIKLLKEVQNNNKKLSILNDKLKYDNHKLKFIFDSLDTIVIIWSNYGVTHYINSFTEKVFGYTDEEFIGNSWMNLIVPSKERTGVDTKKLLEEVISNPDNFAVNHNFNNDKYGNLYYVNWSNLIYSDYYNKRYVLSIGNILEQFSHNQN
jgi:PAS domain S-box-containing protein